MPSRTSLYLLLPYLHDLRKWLLEANWEWNEIWSQQLTNSWEPYWAAVPLGNPNHCAVENAHKHPLVGFGDGSSSDWWVVVLADGDGMGQYISGSKLEKYREYIDQSVLDPNLLGLAELYAEQKRMGPATHIGLNRALLDFSNRLVPYLTEKRFGGKVIYSGGDDVMAVLLLEDLPEYLRSLRAAWSGEKI